MSNDKIELKECPLMHEGDRSAYIRKPLQWNLEGFFVECRGCGLSSVKFYATPELAAEHWNTRSPSPAEAGTDDAKNAWRDISSAPKDETSILLLIPEGMMQGIPPIYVGAYSKHSNEWYTYGASSSGTCWRGEPTHWMPLPPLPQAPNDKPDMRGNNEQSNK